MEDLREVEMQAKSTTATAAGASDIPEHGAGKPELDGIASASSGKVRATPSLAADALEPVMSPSLRRRLKWWWIVTTTFIVIYFITRAAQGCGMTGASKLCADGEGTATLVTFLGMVVSIGPPALVLMFFYMWRRLMYDPWMLPGSHCGPKANVSDAAIDSASHPVAAGRTCWRLCCSWSKWSTAHLITRIGVLTTIVLVGAPLWTRDMGPVDGTPQLFVKLVLNAMGSLLCLLSAVWAADFWIGVGASCYHARQMCRRVRSGAAAVSRHGEFSHSAEAVVAAAEALKAAAAVAVISDGDGDLDKADAADGDANGAAADAADKPADLAADEASEGASGPMEATPHAASGDGDGDGGGYAEELPVVGDGADDHATPINAGRTKSTDMRLPDRAALDNDNDSDDDSSVTDEQWGCSQVSRSAELRRHRFNLTLVLYMLFTYIGKRESYEDPTLMAFDFALDGLPACADGYKLVLLADLHVGPLVGDADVARAVDLVNKQYQVDAVVIAGDIVSDMTPTELGGIVSGLTALTPREQAGGGVFYTTGNHDTSSEGGFDGWRDYISSIGFTTLANNATAVGAAGGPNYDAAANGPCRGFDFVGVNDPTDSQDPDLAAAVQHSRDGVARIMIAHQPLQSIEERAGAHGVGLTLSGHTHGGHAAPLHSMVYLEHGRSIAGMVRNEDDSYVYTSQGAVGWGPRIRFMSEAEHTVITLRSPEVIEGDLSDFNEGLLKPSKPVMVSWRLLFMLPFSLLACSYACLPMDVRAVWSRKAYGVHVACCTAALAAKSAERGGGGGGVAVVAASSDPQGGESDAGAEAQRVDMV